jgi:hypothetical protein
MKDILFIFKFIFAILLYILFCFFSFIYYEQKKTFGRLLTLIGFNLILLKHFIHFSLGYFVKINSLFWRINDFLFNVGILMLFISLTLITIKNE